jgi:hypothetical protein
MPCNPVTLCRNLRTLEETQPLLAPLHLSPLPQQAVTSFPAVSQTQSSGENFVTLTLPAGAITAQLTAPEEQNQEVHIRIRYQPL